MRVLTADIIIRVKASRPPLTGDTRIRLRQIKDLKEWVEDRKIYKPGDISQKTGLQKQPDGSWKEPKGQQRARTIHSEAKGKGSTEGTEEAIEFTEEQKKQTKEIETRINATGWFKHPSTLDGMHPEAAANIEKQCTRIFFEFPQLKGFVEGLKIENFPQNGNKIYAECRGTGKSAFIVFNQSFYENNQRFKEQYADEVSQNYHPAGTDADSVIMHEMAHCMCDFIAKQRHQEMFEFCRELVEFAKESFEKNKIPFDVKAELGRYSVDPAACPDKDTQAAELIAEAYAEFKCSKKPRRLANFIGNLLEGELE